MTDHVRVVTVDGNNLEQEGFFCYKSKPKSEGYINKRNWLENRFAEGMRIKIIYEGKRSVGFIEYIPGEYSWRAVYAPDYLVIHCLWVVGRCKKKGYGSILLEECLKDAREQNKAGLVIVSSSGNWLAGNKLFLKHNFKEIDTAPPSFSLLVRKFNDAPDPYFPADWEVQQARYPDDITIFYSDQCPYMPDVLINLIKQVSQ